MDDRRIDIYRLPETIRSLPIEQFPLNPRLYGQLKTAVVNTLAQLVEQIKTSNHVINKNQKERVKTIVTDLFSSLDENEIPDWERFCELRQMPMLPRNTSLETDA